MAKTQYIRRVKNLDFKSLPKGQISKLWVKLATNGIGLPISVPVLVARGAQEGPVLGLTAALHGNELNGIPVIQQLFSELDLNNLKGTVVGVLVSNVPGLLLEQRKFNDGTDPNHIMPGKEFGTNSEVYVYRLMERIVNRFDYLIDLHTASFGRVNSYYIRADMDNPITEKMALLQNADIIVHNPPHDGTLRGAANDLGIHAITLELGDPHRLQRGMIKSGLSGMHNFMNHFGMIDGEIELPENPPIICSKSYWIYTQGGGILRVSSEITTMVKKGDSIGSLSTVFGDLIKTYKSPEKGIIIGKSVNPVAQTGGRILHLGIV